MQLATLEFEKKPAAHAVQLDAPTDEKVPAAQLMHAAADAAGENEPAAQVVQLEAPADEKVPAAHAVQLDAPEADEKVPAAQATQEGVTPVVHAHTPVALLRLRLLGAPKKPAEQLKVY